MSWKGFSRGVQRTPQTIKAKFNIGDHTKDQVFVDAEVRFQELEKETKNLHEESKKYFNAINSMLNHQKEFATTIADIYRPISARSYDQETLQEEGNPEGIHACEQYEEVVEELKETLAPELEIIDTRIIRPVDELIEVIKMIRKTLTKRQHKLLDYDRHRATLKKLQEKKDRTLKDEKALYKAENDVELATQEFNNWNELLKEELPKLFLLEREFIKPLFQSFYYMQLNIFYTLHERMQRLNIPYFDLTEDLEAAFRKKRGNTQENTEALTIVHFRTTGHRASKLGNKAAKYGKKDEVTPPSSPSTALKPRQNGIENQPPPSYQVATGQVSTAKPKIGRANSVASSFAAAAASKPKPPPPKPKPKPTNLTIKTETAMALYDFDAQAEGDLTFRAGDTIEIVQRTNNENEWWTGKLHGIVGQFPGNYAKLNP